MLLEVGELWRVRWRKCGPAHRVLETGAYSFCGGGGGGGKMGKLVRAASLGERFPVAGHAK